MSDLQLEFSYEKNSRSGGTGTFWSVFIAENGLGKD